MHGNDGFGNADLPLAATMPQLLPAVHALIEASHWFAGELNLETAVDRFSRPVGS